MQVWGVTPGQLQEAVYKVSEEHYNGNLICDGQPDHIGATSKSAVRFKMRVKDSAGAGAHISVDRFGSTKKGYRRTISACWHAHRDVMRAIFEVNPEARIKSVMADYKGSDDFERTFPHTYDTNVGSMVYPVAVGESCLCDGLY